MTDPIPSATEKHPSPCWWRYTTADGHVVRCTATRKHGAHSNKAARVRWTDDTRHAIAPVTDEQACAHPADHRCIDCATDDEMLAALPPARGGTR